MLDYSLPVQWKDGDRHHVGKVAEVHWPAVAYEETILIRHSHTGKLEHVPVSALVNYPSEPIEEPSK